MARAPKFWFNPPTNPGWQARLLGPLGWLFGCITAGRMANGRGIRPGIPVICVGNVNVGGTGKTPTVIALVQHLAARGVLAHVVSRGHGGRLKGPVLVDEHTHTAADAGDEPLLIAAFAPVWVAKDRAEGCLAAAQAGARAVILDDGHQNPSVVKDLTLLVVDAEKGFGNGRCLPAGPLREPVAAGLARGDLLLSIGTEQTQAVFDRNWARSIPLPRLKAQLHPLPTGMDWLGQRVLAFAGIGHPEKFFATLRDLGADLARAEPLDDHQAFTPALLHRLELEADHLDAQLVTTEKDAVRLPMYFRAKVLTLPVRLAVDDWSALDAKLTEIGL